jgi:putative transposase
MPWKETSLMGRKIQFIADFSKKRFSFTELCERYEISRKTGYKWVERYVDDGPGALEDLSRKPHHSPNETDPEIVAELLEFRRKFPSWGGKKILKIIHGLLSIVDVYQTPGISRYRTRRAYSA